MVDQKLLFIVDNDGLFWKGDVLSRAIYEIYNEFFPLRDLPYDSFEKRLMSIYTTRWWKYLRKLINNKQRCNDSDNTKHFIPNPLCKYIKNIEEARNKIEIYEGVENFLSQLKNYGKIVVWTDGLYDYNVKLLRELIPNYDGFVSETLYPEKLTYLGFTKPFKPNQNVVKWLIEKYKPETIFSIGDHPYYDGFLTKSMDNGYSIIVYRKSKDMNDLIRDYWNSEEVRKHYYEIAKLYYSKKLILVNSFDEAIGIILQSTNNL